MELTETALPRPTIGGTEPVFPPPPIQEIDWVHLAQGSNSAMLKLPNGRVETLVYVLFGRDFAAGLRVDRKSWVLIPSHSVSWASFCSVGAQRLPPVRQTADSASQYLQGIDQLLLKTWVDGLAEPLPIAFGTVTGDWLALSQTTDGPAERLLSLQCVTFLEMVM